MRYEKGRRERLPRVRRAFCRSRREVDFAVVAYELVVPMRTRTLVAFAADADQSDRPLLRKHMRRSA